MCISTKTDAQMAMTLSGKKYIELCHQRGLKPKFEDISGLLEHPRFWKVLVDHKMINQKTNTLIEQQALKPNFNFDAAQQLIAQELENYDPTRDARAFKYVQEHLPKSFYKARHSIVERGNGFLTDTNGQERTQTDGNRYSIDDRDKSLSSFVHNRFDVYLRQRLENGILSGDYHMKSESDKKKILDFTPSIFNVIKDKTIPLSDGRIFYFMPDERALKRFNGNSGLAWAEYAMHFLTSSGKQIPGKNYNERLFNQSKYENFGRIEDIVRHENVFGSFDDKNPKNDAVVFVGTSNDGKRIEIISRLDRYGNVKADLTEVTMIESNVKKVIPPLKPLTEVVRTVAQHQGTGFSPLTDNIISPKTEKSSEISKKVEENSRKSLNEGVDVNQLRASLSEAVQQKFGSAGTSLRQVASGFRKIDFVPGTVNLDLGGGKYDEATKYLDGLGVRNLVFDPFNRTAEHNRQIFEEIRNGGVFYVNVDEMQKKVFLKKDEKKNNEKILEKKTVSQRAMRLVTQTMLHNRHGTPSNDLMHNIADVGIKVKSETETSQFFSYFGDWKNHPETGVKGC